GDGLAGARKNSLLYRQRAADYEGKEARPARRFAAASVEGRRGHGRRFLLHGGHDQGAASQRGEALCELGSIARRANRLAEICGGKLATDGYTERGPWLSGCAAERRELLHDQLLQIQ